MITKKFIKDEISRLENKISVLRTVVELRTNPKKWEVISRNGSQSFIQADGYRGDNFGVSFYKDGANYFDGGIAYFPHSEIISIKSL
jgi:hypothetical protein